MTQKSAPRSMPTIHSASDRYTWLRHSRKLLSQQPTWFKAALGLWVIPATLMSTPARAAERIYLSLGPLQRSISVQSLKTFVEEGTTPRELRPYTQYATPDQLEDIRRVLSSRIDLGPVAVSQFLYTDQGEILLKRLGEVIRTEADLPGFYAIRASLILASADPEQGLTPMNVLEKFPVNGIRLDLDRALQVVNGLESLISQTRAAIRLVEQQAAAEGSVEAPLNFAELPDLRRRGPYTWTRQTISMDDRSRDRTFPVDIYLPVRLRQSPINTSVPLVVISHGLGSNRTTFAYIAEQLASYGFAVAVPEHPGSNTEQLQALIAGRANEVAEPGEFINRPLDVKFLLDQLQRSARSDPSFLGRINTQQVGVLGQSFGGYTALALAGAKIDFQRLTVDCANTESLNLSFLLQCRALELPQPLPNFQDERIKAVMAINSLGSSMFGRQDFAAIKIPTMLVAGGADTVTPALSEQIAPFTWLETPDRYLLLLKNATHFSAIDVPDGSGGAVLTLPSDVVGPDPAIAHRYLSTMSVAFFGSHLMNEPNFKQYLGDRYTAYINNDVMPISLIKSLSNYQLAQVTLEK